MRRRAGARSRSPLCIRHSAFCIRRRRGFTLLELILVMLVLTVVLAMVAPSLSGFGAGREAEFAGAQLITMGKWAREQAMSEGRRCRLEFNPQTQTYRVTEQVGGVFQPVAEAFGAEVAVPEGVVMQWDAPQENGVFVIDFLPSGRTQPARVQVTSRDGQVSFIGNRTATEPMRVLTDAEVRAG
jgi:prepilin-type N-terminal cleavage/methylation domain-containing protein